MKDKVIIITGASSGIGKALAYELSKRGCKLVLAARNNETLEKLANELTQQGTSVAFLKTDVSVEKDCENLINFTVERFGQLDVLINNAGISMRALFDEMDLGVFKKVMDVNFYGMIYCTRYAMPHLLHSKGSVVGISSIAGYLGLPARTAYSASKSAMHGFLNALRSENKKTGLHVLLACPGYTESNIRKRALDVSGAEQGESPLKEDKIMSAETVASSIADAIEKRKSNLLLTSEGKMAVFLSKFFPSLIDSMVFKRVANEVNSPIRLK